MRRHSSWIDCAARIFAKGKQKTFFCGASGGERRTRRNHPLLNNDANFYRALARGTTARFGAQRTLALSADVIFDGHLARAGSYLARRFVMGYGRGDNPSARCNVSPRCGLRLRCVLYFSQRLESLGGYSTEGIQGRFITRKRLLHTSLGNGLPL